MENKQNNKRLYILIILLLIIVLALGGFIVYDKILSKSGNDNKVQIKEEERKEEKETNEENNYNDYKVLNDSKNSKKHLVKKIDSKYKVVYTFDPYSTVLGFYDNKFYYANESIMYIDLSSNSIEENILFEVPQPECSQGEYCSSVFVSKGVIVDDILYFNLSSFAGGGEKYDGLLSINLESKDFSECKQLINDIDMDSWYFDSKKTNIFYAKFNYGNGIIPYKYNIETKQNEAVIDRSVSSMYYENNKIIYYFYESDKFDINMNIVYSCNCTPHYELYVFDTDTKQNSLVSKNFNGEGNQILNEASLIDDTIYYSTTNGKIMKYNISNTQSVEFFSIPTFSKYYSFYPLSDDIFVINYQELPDLYLKNGETFNSLEKIEVTMVDNTISYFTIQDFDKSI